MNPKSKSPKADLRRTLLSPRASPRDADGSAKAASYGSLNSFSLGS
jgi:hypothetical protein